MSTSTSVQETTSNDADPFTCTPGMSTRRKQVLGTTGFAVQTSHWGEIVQGPVEYQDKAITGLITLPRKDRSSHVLFRPSANISLVVHPCKAQKAKQAAREVLDRAGMSEFGGELIVANNIREGCGNGSSSADIIASIRASSEAVDMVLSDEEIQHLCWRIEGASDPLALVEDGNAVVYASRHGHILRRLGHSLPPMICLGFNSDPARKVLTASLVGREGFTPEETRGFANILEMAERAIHLGQPKLLGAAATESTRLNQRRVSTRNFELLVKMAAEAGALGVSSSHSGTVCSMIFDPHCPDLCGRLDDLAASLTELRCDDIGVFSVNTRFRRCS